MSAIQGTGPVIEWWHGYKISEMGPWMHTNKSVPSEPGWYVCVVNPESRAEPLIWKMRWWDGETLSIGVPPYYKHNEASVNAAYKAKFVMESPGIYWRKLSV